MSCGDFIPSEVREEEENSRWKLSINCFKEAFKFLSLPSFLRFLSFCKRLILSVLNLVNKVCFSSTSLTIALITSSLDLPTA